MSQTANSFSCQYCGGSWVHPGRVCPKVKSFEYYENGALKKVEFKDSQ